LLLGVDIRDHGADRDFNFEILATCARAVLARAGGAVRRAERTVVAEVCKRVDARSADEVNVRALAAVAAVGAAEGNEFFATKAGRAAPTVAGLNVASSTKRMA
jgi:hypothetical protein